MLKEKDLQELRPQVRYKDGQNISLHTIQVALREAAKQVDIPIAFSTEQVKAGLLGVGEDCLAIYHPEHQKDYFSIAVRIKYQGSYAFVNMDTFGTSKLMKGDAVRKQVLSTAKVGWNRAADPHKDYNVLNDAAAGAAFVGAGIIGIRNLVKGKSDKEKMEAEQQWYTIVCDLLNDIIS